MIQLTDADIGKKFRRRDGEVRAMREYKPGSTYPCRFEGGRRYTAGGRYLSRSDSSQYDIVERIEEPVDDAIIAGGVPKGNLHRYLKEVELPKGELQNVLRKLPDSPTGRKTIPVMTGAVDYFPLAIAEVARVSVAGNEQHNPGQPLRWNRGKSSDHADCILRHLVERGTIDTDGQRHSAKAAWRALALLQEELEAEAGWTPEQNNAAA